MYGTRSCHRTCKATQSQCSPEGDPWYRTAWWEASWAVKIWDPLCILHPTNMLVCDIWLLLPCSSPYSVPTGIILAFFFPPMNSAKSRLMALSVPPTFPPTHSFASGSNKLSNYGSSSSSRQLPNNGFGQEERHSSNLHSAAQPTVRTKSAPPSSGQGKCAKTEACKHSPLPPLPKVITELVCKPDWGWGTLFLDVFKKRASPSFAWDSTFRWIILKQKSW